MEKYRPQLVGEKYLDTKVTDNLRNPAFYLGLPAIRIWEELRGTDIDSPQEVVQEGPALIISNHPGTDSTILLPYAVSKVFERMPTVVVKQSLVDPHYEETTAVLQKTGKAQELDLDKSGKEKTVFSKVKTHLKTGFISNAIGTVPIDRDKLSRQTLEQAQAVLDNEEILAIFLQWTRTPENSLENAMPLAASFVRNNPDVPVYLMAQTNTDVRFESDWQKRFQRRHPQVKISEPFRLTDESFNQGRPMNRNRIHDELVDRMENMLGDMGVTNIIREPRRNST